MSTKDKRWTLNQRRRALAKFGLDVLRTLEEDKRWSSATLDEIVFHAMCQSLVADNDDEDFVIEPKIACLSHTALNRRDR